jgi:hypothetical protein
MNWEAIGAVAEVLALIGVIASLIYVGIQLSESSKQSRIDIYNWSQGMFSDWTLNIATDDESSRIFHEGIRDFANLKPIDQTRFRLLMGNYLGIFDNIFNHHNLGVFMDEPGYERHMEMVGRIIAMPGVQKWYTEFNGRHTLHPAFAEYLDQLIGDQLDESN